MRRALVLAAALIAAPAAAKDPTWTKTVVDPKFRSEGVAIADVNKDGKKDVLVGEIWYEAPDWKPHEMQKPGDYKDGMSNYSNVFACWADDLNADGFPDLVVVGFPGAPAYWLENPKGVGTADGKPTHWKKHVIWHSACNESPQYADLLGTGKKVLVMGAQPKGKENEGQMAYFTPNPTDPAALWDMHPVSDPASGKAAPGTHKFAHGLGVADVNGDGKLDVLTTGGWWEQPDKADGKTPWPWHPAGLGDGCADMFTLDVDGDGKLDVLSTSAHKYGIWWHKQRPAKDDKGHPTFEKRDLFPKLVSETHAAHFVDVDGDGLKDLVTGKRKYSHGLSEPDAAKPATIYYLKQGKPVDGVVPFTPTVIDEDSGIGTQFVVDDINGDGLPDVVTSNKKGVFAIVQSRK